MKINLKTTTGRTTEVDFDSDATIRAVKESLKDEYDLPSLRLCYQGKILEDSKPLSELGDGAVLFIAGKKASIPKPVVTPATSEASPSSPVVTSATATATAETTPAPAASGNGTTTTVEPVANTVAESSTPAVPPATQPEPQAQPQAEAGPSVDEDLVTGIQAMGFDDRELIKLALRAAYMNPDRAVDYLCNGTPRSTLQRLADEASPQHVAPRVHATGAAPAHPPAAPTSALSQAIASIPNFEQVRQVIQANPASLPTFMQQLQQNHPEVFALVQQNPEEFLQLIQNDARQAEPVTAGATSVQLTPADQQAIQELAELGGGAWDLQAAALVYIAVNKNKEVAAAVLFEHGGLPPQLVQAILDQQGGSSADDEADE